MHKRRERISGWGNYPRLKAMVILPATVDELQRAVAENPSVLARGSSSSYGDSSLHHTVISTWFLNSIIGEGKDWIEVEAGITIKALLQHIVPQKKFLPVTPGTKIVTIGGAIASDVHGKNHLHQGSFFNSTISLQLINEDGELIHCSREKNSHKFYDCFGGMGLSGIVVSAVLKLIPMPSVWMKQQQYFAADVKELFAIMEANRTAPYLVAWIDLLNSNTMGMVKTGSWQTVEELPNHLPQLATTGHKSIQIPFRFPISPPAFLFRWYNKKYLSKAKQNHIQLLHYTQFFYPLDSIKNWKYVFGPKGLLQYHFVLPLPVAETGIPEIIGLVKNSGAVCTLAVLKLFGKANGETPNAFAREGYNLALDFIHTSQAVALITKIDTIVQSFGGQVYKAKDAFSALPVSLKKVNFNPYKINAMIENNSGRHILILGAGSDMAVPFIQLLFKEWSGCNFYLLARNISLLTELAAQGKSMGHTVELYPYDVLQPAPLHFSNIEYCVTYVGWLPDDKDAFEKSMLLNFTGIETFLNTLIENSRQTLKHVMITGSVAGVRCRPTNRAYGLAKTALHKYALQLHKKWAGKIKVTLTIPGYVRTKMITHLQTPALLTLTPEQLAHKYYKWISSKPRVVYSQLRWQLISTTLKLLPEFIIKRLTF